MFKVKITVVGFLGDEKNIPAIWAQVMMLSIIAPIFRPGSVQRLVPIS
jgi:hypothetical protein